MRVLKFVTTLTATTGLLALGSVGAHAQKAEAQASEAQAQRPSYQAHTTMFQGASYSVQLNKTQIVHLPEPAAAVVVGNPNVADVTVHSSDTIFIVGRGYGDTNIIIMNSAGQTIMNADVHVTISNARNNVRVYAGSSTMRSSYNCSPYCQPAPILGDNPDFVGANSPEVRTSTNTIAGGATMGAPGVIGMATESEMSLEENHNPNEIDATSNDY